MTVISERRQTPGCGDGETAGGSASGCEPNAQERNSMARFFAWVPALLLCLFVLQTQAGGPRVVVRPFEVYNAPDIEALMPGLQAMLASRLAGQDYRVTTSTEEAPEELDWTVRTTITHLGGVYSVDAVLEPMSDVSEGTRTYETADSPQQLMTALEEIASRLKATLRTIPRAISPRIEPETIAEAPERSPPPAAPPTPEVAKPGEPSAPSPVGAEVARSAPIPEPAPAPSPPVAPAVKTAVPAAPPVPPAARTASAEDLGLTFGDHRQGPSVPGEALSLAVADVDGDGSAEILLLFEDKIRAYRDRIDEIVFAWESPAPRNMVPSRLSVGDIDGNGLPEVFVAGMRYDQPVSQALEWSGSSLSLKGKRIPGFVRVLEHPERGPVLSGMLAGASKQLFSKQMRTFAWEGGEYREKDRFRAPQASIPINLDLAPLGGGDEPYLVVTTQADLLQVYDPTGARLFEGNDRVKGTRTYVEGPQRLAGEQDVERDFYWVYGKTSVWRGPGGSSYLLLPRNHAGLTRFLGKTRVFSHGQVSALTWDGLTLVPVAEGPKLPGYIPDLDVGPSPGRAQASTLYVALVQSQGAFFKNTSTLILSYDLPVPQVTSRP